MGLGFSTQPSLKTFRSVQPWQPVKTGRLGKSRTPVTPGVSPVSTTQHDPRGCAFNSVLHSPCQNGASFADERPAAIVNRPPGPPRKGLRLLNVARVLAACSLSLPPDVLPVLAAPGTRCGTSSPVQRLSAIKTQNEMAF
jgi:hypothetical protein